jgi:PAS domain-containing protein
MTVLLIVLALVVLAAALRLDVVLCGLCQLKSELRQVRDERIELAGILEQQTRRVCQEANAVRDDQGEFLMSCNVIYDVSEAHALRLRMLGVLDEQYAMLDYELIDIARPRGGRIVWANRAVHRVFGYAYGELIGRPVALL